MSLTEQRGLGTQALALDENQLNVQLDDERRDEVRRLKEVQSAVRDMIWGSPQLALEVVRAHEWVLSIEANDRRAGTENWRREQLAVAEHCKRGLMEDPEIHSGDPTRAVVVVGLYPVAVCQRELEQERLPAAKRSAAFLKTVAGLVVAAVERDLVYQDREKTLAERERMAAEWRSKKQSGKFVEVRRRFEVKDVGYLKRIPDPYSEDPAKLRLWKGADWRMICLDRIGGLADLGAVEQVIPEPEGDDLNALMRRLFWRARQPYPMHLELPSRPVPDPVCLSAEMAKEMWACVRNGAIQSKPVPAAAFTEPHLRDVHYAILETLENRGGAMLIAQIWQDERMRTYGRDQIRDACKELITWSLVQGVLGGRKGISINSAGRDQLSRHRSVFTAPEGGGGKKKLRS